MRQSLSEIFFFFSSNMFASVFLDGIGTNSFSKGTMAR